MMDDKSKEPQPLNYLSPRDDVQMHKERRGQRVRGAVFACSVVLSTVVIFGLSTIRIGMPGPPSRHDQIMAMFWPIGGLSLLIAVAAYQHFRRRRRWLVQGVLIGIGIAALIEGACFGLLR